MLLINTFAIKVLHGFYKFRVCTVQRIESHYNFTYIYHTFTYLLYDDSDRIFRNYVFLAIEEPKKET